MHRKENSLCKFIALWVPCTSALAQVAMSRWVSERNQYDMTPRGVPHRTQNTVV